MGMSERDVQSFVYFLSLHCKLAVLGMTVRSAAGRGRVLEAQPRRLALVPALLDERWCLAVGAA